MFGQKFFPYSTLQELNLDWILTKVKNILRFVPDDGAVGQILRRTRDGAEWSDEQGGGGAVNSVNGQTGTVVLTASDVGALPDSYTAPVTSVNTKTGAVVLTASDVGALPDSYTSPVTSVNTKTGAVVLDKTDVGLGNVANVAQYSASNPPPYPVTSVNGQTGDVVIQAAEWTLIGSASGSSSVSISNQYKSFSIDAQYGTSSVFFPLSVTYEQLASIAKLFTVGYYINASTNGFCQFSVSNSAVSILGLYINGVNYTSTSNLRVFGQ